jgi:hypothetical protein
MRYYRYFTPPTQTFVRLAVVDVVARIESTVLRSTGTCFDILAATGTGNSIRESTYRSVDFQYQYDIEHHPLLS